MLFKLKTYKKNCTEGPIHPPKEENIILFKEAKHTMAAEELAHARNLLKLLFSCAPPHYEETVSTYMQSLRNKSFSLKGLIEIIAYDPTIAPTAKIIIASLSHESRQKIIGEIAKVWPHHQPLIKRMQHISYLGHFCERKFPEISFLSVMPAHIIAQLILENETPPISET